MGGQEAEITVGSVTLRGTLNIPDGATGLVLFVHGSGSSRFSSRNRFVAQTLVDAGLATLVFDLLSEEEEQVDQYTAQLRFDIGLLTQRVVAVTSWLRADEHSRGLALGYFGASTGAAAALAAAARLPGIAAVVSRGGRPDLVLDELPQVQAPTLLIVGGADTVVIDMNRRALAALKAERELHIVPGASHLFEEPGALEAVADLAAGWFRRYLGAAPLTSP